MGLTGYENSDSASDAPLYREPDLEGTDLLTSPRSTEVGGASPAQEATQPGTSQTRVDLLYINGHRLRGALRVHRLSSQMGQFWKVIVSEKRKASEIRLLPENQAHACLHEKRTGSKMTREQLVFRRVCGEYMEAP